MRRRRFGYQLLGGYWEWRWPPGLIERRWRQGQTTISRIYDSWGRVLLAEGVFAWNTRDASEVSNFGVFMSDLLKKALAAEKPAKAKGAKPVEDPMFRDCPVVLAYLTTSQLDGQPRQTATINLSVDQGIRKVMLKDRHLARVAWGSGDTFAEAVAVLEARLAEGTCEWREDQFVKSRKGK